MKRPGLSGTLTPGQFQEDYYLKEELQAFLKARGVTATGSKVDLNERIFRMLHGNVIRSVVKQKKVKNNRTDTLRPDSIIEKDLARSQKHRAFFKSIISDEFFFHMEFQDWPKTHAEQTYQDTVDAWYAIQEQKEHKRTVINPQFEHNACIRTFFANNPERSLKETIMCWNRRKTIPGPYVYQKEGLLVSNEQEDERQLNFI